MKGAFTGANYERLGCFRAAEGGTIFLDEIGELSAELQSKLLRTIQERVVVPVGSDRPEPVDVRIVAATNRNLSDEVASGRFRLDLFYRLNVISLQSLPLEDRTDDIQPLANHFLDKMSIENGLPHKRLASSAISAMKAYAWPGNVRELQNVLERAVIFSSSDLIGAETLSLEVDMPPAIACDSAAAESAPPSDSPWPTLAEVQAAHLRATLAHTLYNQTAAADLLAIDRATLARMIARHRLSIPNPRRGRPAKTPSPLVGEGQE